MKIILDTNIWISFLLGKRLSILVDIFKKENISIFVSNHLLAEISTVACRPKFSSYITQEALNNLLELISIRCIFTQSTSEEIEKFNLRDRKDLFILAMAVNSKANLIVTGDKDLLTLNQFHDTEIIPFSEFQKRISI